MRLPDGTVVPHYMGVRNTAAQRGGPPGFFDEVRLLVGEVTAIHYPDDEANVTGDTEYTVTVWRRKSAGAVERLALHCSQADLFGSLADWFRFSFRPATDTPDGEALGNGATVLVACINGDRSNAYIIGAIPQPKRDQVDPDAAEGRYLRSRFNGVELSIQDDGSFSLTVPGAVTTEGEPDPNRDENNRGSRVTFEANGDITIEDQAGETIKVSPGSKTVSIESSEKLTETCDTAEVEAQTSWHVKTGQATVVCKDIRLGADEIPSDNGAVFGQGIDPFTGLSYDKLRNASKTVKVTR